VRPYFIAKQNELTVRIFIVNHLQVPVHKIQCFILDLYRRFRKLYSSYVNANPYEVCSPIITLQ